MIELKNISKNFQDIAAISHISASLDDGMILGLVGSNGSGKSTLLRLMSGILKPDEGSILIDDQAVYDNPFIKSQICFLSDTAYFFPNATPASMGNYYALMYPDFDKDCFHDLLIKAELEPRRKISTFSKGMTKQVSIFLGLCSNTKYLFCDETFDGLDPVMRQTMKSLFAENLMQRNFTPVIASHNLRELEDICDSICLLHDGELIFSQDIDEIKCNVYKIQCVLKSPEEEKRFLSNLTVLHYEKAGSLMLVTVRGTRECLTDYINGFSPVFAEILPLSLEEIFISETEVAGYDIHNILS